MMPVKKNYTYEASVICNIHRLFFVSRDKLFDHSNETLDDIFFIVECGFYLHVAIPNISKDSLGHVDQNILIYIPNLKLTPLLILKKIKSHLYLRKNRSSCSARAYDLIYINHQVQIRPDLFII